MGETDTISAFDIGIILNNLLDNAIEACEKLEQEQRYINLTLKKKNHFLLIEVENSFDGKVIWEDGGIVPMTTKQSDLPDILMEHGIGLKNVKNVADHYLGDMDIKIKNDVFKVKGVTRIQTQNITDQRFNSAVCGIVTGTVEEIDASVLTKQFTDFFNTYSAAVLDEFSAYKQSMEKYLTEIAGVYDSYVSKTEGLFAQYESQFNERYSSFESTLDNWDKELLSAYTEFMAKIKLFQSDAENEFNTWFESIKDKLGEDIAGSLQLQIEELAAAMQEVKKQAEAGTKETKEAIAALDERLKRVESGWGIDYKHDAVLGLCYMGAAYMSQHYERTVETAVLGATYVGNSYLANTF